MKLLYSVLVLTLVLAVVSMAPVQAGIIRGEGLTIPGSGGGVVEDGDHPWGGDMVIGGGGDVTKTNTITVYTGVTVIDVLISVVVYDGTFNVTTGSAKVVQSATYSETAVSIRPSPAVTSSRSRQVSFRKER